MLKPQLNDREFLEELNRVLKEQEEHVEGMEFVLNPICESGERLQGYGWSGTPSNSPLMAKVHAIVISKYDFKSS